MAKKQPRQYLVEDNIIIDEIYPKVAEVMPRKMTALKGCIERFIHFRNKSLYDYAPVERIFFKPSDEMDFFNSIGIKKEEITAILPKLYYWKEAELQACKDEFSLTCLMCLRWLIKEQPKKQDLISLTATYLAFSGKYYSACHYKCWPNYTPKREVMDYVVNYMMSEKFDLIRTKSVFGAIDSLSDTWIKTYNNEFTDDVTDERIVLILIHQLYNRVFSFLKNISKLYYKAYEEKLYVNAESDSFEQDNFRIANSNITRIATVTENSMNYFTSTKVNLKLCYAVSGSGVDPLDIKSIFETILSDNQKLSDLKFVIGVMLSDFCNKYPNESDITGPKFIAHSIGMKPNTKDKNLIKEKNIILEWLNTSERYRGIKTPATRNNYYKGILSYIALIVNTANKDKSI